MFTESILGIDVYNGNKDYLLKQIKNSISKGKKISIMAANPEKIVLAKEDNYIKKVLCNASYLIPDGIGIVIASKTGKNTIKRRIPGIDLMDDICKLANENSYRVFLFGASKKILYDAEQNIKKKFPMMKIVGTFDGYSENENLVSYVNKTKPNIIFVALGSPKQEIWIHENMDKINAQIFQGVGGSFDVYSGKVKRSPKVFSLIGLEWLYRLIKNPKRAKRQKSLLKFMLLVIKKEKI